MVVGVTTSLDEKRAAALKRMETEIVSRVRQMAQLGWHGSKTFVVTVRDGLLTNLKVIDEESVSTTSG